MRFQSADFGIITSLMIAQLIVKVVRKYADKAEVHFVCLPSLSEAVEIPVQAQPSVPTDLLDLLKSLHVHSLKDEEVLLLKDAKKLTERKDSISQTSWSKAICIIRQSPELRRSIGNTIFALLTKYTTGIKYALELHSLQKTLPDSCQTEDDDTNQSVSSIEDDFVTAFEHLDEEEMALSDHIGHYNQRSQRDVASQTVPSHCRDTAGSRIIISSVSKKSSAKPVYSPPEGSVSLKGLKSTLTSDPDRQRGFYRPSSPHKGQIDFALSRITASLTESDESECSSPSPIIFLDEEGYQKSLKAKLDIPKIPVLKDGVEDSDSEVSEFFDSFDQFDELDQALASNSKIFKEPASASQTQKKKFMKDYGCNHVSRDGSKTAGMNPHKFDQPVLPANVKKPMPLKPESPYGIHSDVPDSPRPVRASCEESGALFSPVRSSAFSPLGCCNTSEYFWKDEDNKELRKPQDLCKLYKTYSDYASNLSEEILGSVYGYTSPVDTKLNKNLSCVCHMKFKNTNGHLVKLADIQQTVTIAKTQQKSQSLKDGIQKFATDLVERSLGSAFRDLQKGVSSCTTTLCHLAARLTSSVFQMAFHEIGMRHAYVLKERAINGLASFLVGEAVSGALKEFRYVKKQIFNNTVARFAADLAEELVFEGIMEVCQFSHPSTPLTPSEWSFEQEEKVVTSYAADLSESVLQEAFIELSQADVTFTTQAAISVSVDNIRYVRAENTAQTTKTCNASTNYFGLPGVTDQNISNENICTVKKALFCTSGIASCIPVPVAGKIISQVHTPADVCQNKSGICLTSETGPRKSRDSEHNITVASSAVISITKPINSMLDLGPVLQGSHISGETEVLDVEPSSVIEESISSDLSSGKTSFQNFSGSMVDMIVNEAYELMTSSKVKKTVGECAEFLSKKIVDRIPSVSPLHSIPSQNPSTENSTDCIKKHNADKEKTKVYNTSEPDSLLSCGGGKTDPVMVSIVQNNPNINLKLQDTKWICSGAEDDTASKYAANQKKEKVSDQISVCSVQPQFNSEIKSIARDSEPCSASVQLSSGEASRIHYSLMRDHMEVSCHEAPGQCVRRVGQAAEETLNNNGRKPNVSPGTPPPTPQLPQLVSREQEFRRFSKKLKGKLAKEFSPATPPSTPHYHHAEGGSDTEKADFMLKLMRSLSDEVEGIEDEEEDAEAEDDQLVAHTGTCQRERSPSVENDQEAEEKGAIHYADHLACHIVSMATEMATLCLEDGRKFEDCESKDLPLYSALIGQFSEQSLNSLWTYAGEMAGEVISDVKKILGSSQCKHSTLKRVRDSLSECHQLGGHRDYRLSSMTGQVSGDLLNSGLSFRQSSSASGLTSKYPSCESVTDEYAGYLIRVLKREGGNTELILDQYASRLAYRSIKSGLAQAARKIKQRCNLRLYSTRRSHHENVNEFLRVLTTEQASIDARRKVDSFSNAPQCKCQPIEGMSRRDYMELVGFAESLAYNITCDVTRKLRSSAVRLPKSLTDSCLYKKSRLEDMAEDLIKTTFSCSLLPYTENSKQYHSTGSLNDGNCSDSVMQVIEHYARKIVDDTLEMTMASVHHQSEEDKRKMDRDMYAGKLSETALNSALASKTCRYCAVREHPYYFGTHCSNAAKQHFQEIHRRRRRESDAKTENCCSRMRGCSLGIPRIHIDLDQKAVFAEEMVSSAIERAKRELSSTSLTADSGIGHDGASFAESLTTEILTSAMSNVCQTINISAAGKEGFHTSESTVSQQLSLSVGDDSTGSWSNLSFEDEHPDENSSFLHLSDSNGNSSSWSSLGLEGDIYEENLSYSPSDSDGTEDKETEPKEDSDGLLHVEKGLLVVNTDVRGQCLDPQIRTVLQWIAVSHSELPVLQFGQPTEKELQFLPLVIKKVKEREWKLGDLLQSVLRYCEEMDHETTGDKPFFQWLLDP
ncbi:A-kinase anchor protein 11 isoform X2 [Lepisosteus oculatus]|uniref:A-kinase anchor protein 11 isoform X2 n=1 Tax=Lepisosteus oculatus TaxID=7918 RepID=UPI0035F523C6